MHDVLLFYSRSDTFFFNSLKVAADKTKLPHTLITVGGVKYQTYELTAPGATSKGESGQPWRGYDPNKFGRHWGNSHALMDEWDAEGLIHWPDEDGWPRRRAAEPFDPESRTITVADVWTDIDRLNQTAKERLGYPTQKPEALMDRVILASSREGGAVLDPFCGCGTTVASAQRLNRRWIGIDITNLAISLIRHRLRDSYGDRIEGTYKVIGEPVSLPDAKTLAASDPYQFQWWALGLVGARPVEGKKGADKGIDGRIYFHEGDGTTRQMVLSVKAGKLHAPYVRDLRGVVEREKAAMGVLLTLEEPTKAMRTEAASAGFYRSPWGQHPKLQIMTVGDLLEGKRLDAPPTRQTSVTFKRAPKAATKTASQPRIFDDEEQPF